MTKEILDIEKKLSLADETHPRVVIEESEIIPISDIEEIGAHIVEVEYELDVEGDTVNDGNC